jgi:signal peptidase I
MERFSLVLVILTAAAGAIALADVLLFKRRRIAAAARGLPAKEPLLIEYARSFFPILLIVLVVRSFVFEPFRIPSGSMLPTLEEGDFIFVNKFAYGLRLPVLNDKVVQIGEPQHGDVIVFRLPSDPSINYIKRVVGLPGDVVVYDRITRRLTINDSPVAMEVTGSYEGDPNIEVAHEQLGKHEHDVLLMQREPSRGGTYKVPAGHYFVMGDNRDNSRDSRFDGVEYIPEENLVGRAVGIWMNWRWPAEGGPRWSRIGKAIE